MTDFADRLKEYRTTENQSLSDLAKKLGTTKQVLSRYERRERFPKSDLVKKYAAKLGVDPSWLIGFDSEPINTTSQKQFLMNKIAKADDRKLDKIRKLMELIDDEEVNND